MTDPLSPPSNALLLRPPQQERSRRTLAAFVDATRTLLEDQGEPGVTVLKVVERAGVSVGAFYARFEGRNELIRYVGEKSLEDALEDWSAASLSEIPVLRDALTRLAGSLLHGPPRTLVLLDGHQDPSPSRLRRFEERVAQALRLFDPFPSPPREGDLLRALFLAAGIRELAGRAIEGGDHDRLVPDDPEVLASIGLSMLPREDGKPEEEAWLRDLPVEPPSAFTEEAVVESEEDTGAGLDSDAVAEPEVERDDVPEPEQDGAGEPEAEPGDEDEDELPEVDPFDVWG